MRFEYEQVKQQKKSSNKWICVVCNQKQSVRKVFAQGLMAKDVRKFVQSFNMSRQFAHQQQEQLVDEEEETLAPSTEKIDNHDHWKNKKVKRIDWTEYIDPQDEADLAEIREEEEEQSELFYSCTQTTTGDGEKTYRPVFAKRNINKQINSREEEPSKSRPMKAQGNSKWGYNATQAEENFPNKNQRIGQPTTCMGSSKWKTYITKDDDDNFADKVPCKCQPITVERASKWTGYVEEDGDDDLQAKSGRDKADYMGQWNHNAFDTIEKDQKVEEDIHPDFL
ncbi:unnamed protein product [Ilex paraguariensis]|uniref:MRN complex-interacting protein N-terminal domain-containing protein n=1 Tax=Ilex paraguariensis TaxID=185542 RepID=A0ABC8TZ72_9AQUA